MKFDEDFVAGEIRKLERESADELAARGLAPKLEKIREDDLIKQAVLKTAEDIVSKVMSDNAARMNEAIGKQVEALVGDQMKLINDLVEATIERRIAGFLEKFKNIDEKDRADFLTALAEIGVTGARSGK